MTISSDPPTGPIVVSGATGGQGGAVATALLARDQPVRALTRDPDGEAAAALRDAGAEVVAADLMDRASLDAALAGVSGVFSVQDFLAAGVDAEIEMGLNLTDAAIAAEVGHVVYSAASTSDRNTGVAHLDSKWIIERRLRDAGVPFTVFRPAAFMDNWAWERDQILDTGTISLPLRPDSTYRQVAVADIGAMAAIAFADPVRWVGRIAPLAGDAATPVEIAATFSSVSGRRIEYRQMSWDECLETQGEELTSMYRAFDEFGMDGDPTYLRRWHPDALDLDAYLTVNGWNEPS